MKRGYTEPPDGPVEYLPVVGDSDMPRSTYFVQECPTCGRNLQVRVEYLGRQLECQHCHAQFYACEPGSAPDLEGDSGLSLLERAEMLLQSASMSMPIAAGADFGTDVMPLPSVPR
jgi:hypothetical protein